MTGGLISGSVAAFFFVWLAHRLFPEPTLDAAARRLGRPPRNHHRPSRCTVQCVPRQSSCRSSYGCCSRAITAGYAVVLIKVATMGQQSGQESTRAAARDLLLSTLVGGVAAMIVWNELQIWPTTLIYSLLFLMCGLVIGPTVFSGDGMTPRAAMWSYGLLTMMVIVMPGAIDSAGGAGAGVRFSDRMVMSPWQRCMPSRRSTSMIASGRRSQLIMRVQLAMPSDVARDNHDGGEPWLHLNPGRPRPHFN